MLVRLLVCSSLLFASTLLGAESPKSACNGEVAEIAVLRKQVEALTKRTEALQLALLSNSAGLEADRLLKEVEELKKVAKDKK